MIHFNLNAISSHFSYLSIKNKFQILSESKSGRLVSIIAGLAIAFFTSYFIVNKLKTKALDISKDLTPPIKKSEEILREAIKEATSIEIPLALSKLILSYQYYRLKGISQSSLLLEPFVFIGFKVSGNPNSNVNLLRNGNFAVFYGDRIQIYNSEKLKIIEDLIGDPSEEIINCYDLQNGNLVITSFNSREPINRKAKVVIWDSKTSSQVLENYVPIPNNTLRAKVHQIIQTKNEQFVVFVFSFIRSFSISIHNIDAVIVWDLRTKKMHWVEDVKGSLHFGGNININVIELENNMFAANFSYPSENKNKIKVWDLKEIKGLIAPILKIHVPFRSQPTELSDGRLVFAVWDETDGSQKIVAWDPKEPKSPLAVLANAGSYWIQYIKELENGNLIAFPKEDDERVILFWNLKRSSSEPFVLENAGISFDDLCPPVIELNGGKKLITICSWFHNTIMVFDLENPQNDPVNLFFYTIENLIKLQDGRIAIIPHHCSDGIRICFPENLEENLKNDKESLLLSIGMMGHQGSTKFATQLPCGKFFLIFSNPEWKHQIQIWA